MPVTRSGIMAGFVLAVILLLLWFGLSNGQGWLFGTAAAAVVLFISQTLAPLPAMRVSLPGLLRFLGFFLRGSLAGGADVARRALAPGLPLSIHRHRHRLRLPAGAPRAVLVGVISLLPGTLSVWLDGDELLVHSIAGDPGERVQDLELRVAELFGSTTDRGTGHE